MAAVPSRSTAPSSVNAVAIAVSIRPKGAGDVMEVRLLRHAGLMVVLVPRQLQMTGMTGNVPYYGGRLSPAQAYAASHPRAAPAPAPPRPDPVEALDGLLESGVISEEEYHQLRDRLAT
jgi:hypothetical protein